MMRYLHFLSVIVALTSLRAGDEVAATFTYNDPVATTVEVAGEFSNWKMLPMAKDNSGNWTKTVFLKPGQYGYKFIVNGEWKLDPKNSARKSVNGIENSAITAGKTDSPLPSTAVAGTTFTYADPTAKAVFIAGQFNDWNTTANPLKKDESGIWTITIPLKPGKHPYKFIVDGDWRIDPTNPDTLDDGAGNQNSVKTIAP